MALFGKKKKQDAGPSLRKRFFAVGRVTAREKILFAKNLALMIRAAYPLREGLMAMEEQTRSRYFRKVVSSVIHDIENGQSLADALSRFPNVFDNFFISIVRIGETSGKLEENLAYLAFQLEKNLDLRRKVRAAMIYPLFVLAAGVGVGLLVVFFVFPKLLPVFKSLEVKLPLPTQLLLGLTEWTLAYWPYLLVGCIVVVIVLRLLLLSRRVKWYAQKFLLHVPVIRPMIINVTTAYYARTLGILLKSGVQIFDSLLIIAKSVSNLLYQREFEALALHIQRGETISGYLQARHHLFPPMVGRLISVGEKTGTLVESLGYISEFYEKEVDDMTKNLSTILEPILLLGVGIFVAFMALSIILPIYQLTGGIEQQE